MVKVKELAMDTLDGKLYAELLKGKGTVYDLAKRCGIAWSTARIHLYYLQEMGLASYTGGNPSAVGGFKDIWEAKK